MDRKRVGCDSCVLKHASATARRALTAGCLIVASRVEQAIALAAAGSKARPSAAARACASKPGCACSE